MTNTEKNTQMKNSAADSFLGMALVQTFSVMAFSPVAGSMINAAGAASDFYEDRMSPKKRTNGRVYGVGEKQSLMGDFGRFAFGADAANKDEKPAHAPFMRPLGYGPSLAA